MRPGSFAQIRYAGPPGWRRIPPVTRATLALSAAGYVAGLVAPDVLRLLAADPYAILRLELWRLATYPLVVQGIWNLLFGLLLFWALGSDLEPDWGARKYGLFLISAVVAAGLLGVGAAAATDFRPGAVGYGISGLLTAVIAAWAWVGPRLPVSFFGVLPMTRGIFAVLSVVLIVFGELESSRSAVRLVFLVGGIPVAWLFTRGTGRWRPSGPGRRWARFAGRRRFRVVPGEPERFH